MGVATKENNLFKCSINILRNISSGKIYFKNHSIEIYLNFTSANTRKA